MESKLKEIKIENIIIYIYIGLLLLYLYANNIEVNYVKYGDEYSKNKYRSILYIVFGGIFIISLYYVISSIQSLDEDNSQELKKLVLLSNILILTATIILLYIVYVDENIDVEVSPS